MSKETGGPAFPFPSTMPNNTLHVSSMTLRDYFAAKVMSGLVVGRATYMVEWAEEAYRAADAMLVEREK